MSGYKRHLASEKAPQPLTRAEEELNEVKASEHRTEISIETKHQVWTLTEYADFLFINFVTTRRCTYAGHCEKEHKISLVTRPVETVQTVGGIAFPLTKAAVASVTEFRVRPRESNYVQLAIDIEKEMVNVSRSEH